ncbi:uncharacterized protein LOC129771379 isoform X2 [Toxorhynchites rutilus septentrionalis]|uniref:uncharacterized protein LOC129771379 isoform X2 n=1 Tax=Toxorhynchites rutilus septentrionalis TaxID=329112 RepID=UPI002478D54B|nr:uncharacterized protein LOC129771379 isoform X2 [Toxorhynchites rutilus septentrionalis]
MISFTHGSIGEPAGRVANRRPHSCCCNCHRTDFDCKMHGMHDKVPASDEAKFNTRTHQYELNRSKLEADEEEIIDVCGWTEPNRVDQLLHQVPSEIHHDIRRNKRKDEDERNNYHWKLPNYMSMNSSYNDDDETRLIVDWKAPNNSGMRGLHNTGVSENDGNEHISRGPLTMSRDKQTLTDQLTELKDKLSSSPTTPNEKHYQQYSKMEGVRPKYSEYHRFRERSNPTTARQIGCNGVSDAVTMLPSTGSRTRSSAFTPYMRDPSLYQQPSNSSATAFPTTWDMQDTPLQFGFGTPLKGANSPRQQPIDLSRTSTLNNYPTTKYSPQKCHRAQVPYSIKVPQPPKPPAAAIRPTPVPVVYHPSISQVFRVTNLGAKLRMTTSAAAEKRYTQYLPRLFNQPDSPTKKRRSERTSEKLTAPETGSGQLPVKKLRFIGAPLIAHHAWSHRMEKQPTAIRIPPNISQTSDGTTRIEEQLGAYETIDGRETRLNEANVEVSVTSGNIETRRTNSQIQVISHLDELTISVGEHSETSGNTGDQLTIPQPQKVNEEAFPKQNSGTHNKNPSAEASFTDPSKQFTTMTKTPQGPKMQESIEQNRETSAPVVSNSNLLPQIQRFDSYTREHLATQQRANRDPVKSLNHQLRGPKIVRYIKLKSSQNAPEEFEDHRRAQKGLNEGSASSTGQKLHENSRPRIIQTEEVAQFFRFIQNTLREAKNNNAPDSTRELISELQQFHCYAQGKQRKDPSNSEITSTNHPMQGITTQHSAMNRIFKPKQQTLWKYLKTAAAEGSQYNNPMVVSSVIPKQHRFGSSPTKPLSKEISNKTIDELEVFLNLVQNKLEVRALTKNQATSVNHQLHELPHISISDIYGFFWHLRQKVYPNTHREPNELQPDRTNPTNRSVRNPVDSTSQQLQNIPSRQATAINNRLMDPPENTKAKKAISMPTIEYVTSAISDDCGDRSPVNEEEKQLAAAVLQELPEINDKFRHPSTSHEVPIIAQVHNGTLKIPVAKDISSLETQDVVSVAQRHSPSRERILRRLSASEKLHVASVLIRMMPDRMISSMSDEQMQRLYKIAQITLDDPSINRRNKRFTGPPPTGLLPSGPMHRERDKLFPLGEIPSPTFPNGEHFKYEIDSFFLLRKTQIFSVLEHFNHKLINKLELIDQMEQLQINPKRDYKAIARSMMQRYNYVPSNHKGAPNYRFVVPPQGIADYFKMLRGLKPNISDEVYRIYQMAIDGLLEQYRGSITNFLAWNLKRRNEPERLEPRRTEVPIEQL